MEAERLTAWLDGVRVGTVYPSTAMKVVDWIEPVTAPCREQPKQAPPPVQRLRVRYAKRGRLRFTSHRDFSRAFERAVFRARLPMAYSSGFNPHPRISYAGAAPTGSASEAEYLELALAEVVDPAAVHAALDEALPDGLDVVEVVVVAGRWLRRPAAGQPVADRAPGARRPRPQEAVTTFLAAEEVVVQRMTKKGLRDFDSRAAVLGLDVVPVVGETGPARSWSWSCGTRSPRSGPMTCSRRSGPWPGWSWSAYPCSPGRPRGRWTSRPVRSATRSGRRSSRGPRGSAIPSGAQRRRLAVPSGG